MISLHKEEKPSMKSLTPVGDYNNNRYGVEERARKQALPFIENKLPKGGTTYPIPIEKHKSK